jgi:predicted phosphodiesterase
MGRIRWLFGRKPDPAALPAFLLEQFAEDDVHAVMFGHTHRPYVKMHGGVLLFNPGAAVVRAAQSPSVGILDIGERRITGRIVIL